MYGYTTEPYTYVFLRFFLGLVLGLSTSGRRINEESEH